MPKVNGVFGVAKLNLAYAVLAYVVANQRVASVEEIAQHFECSEREIIAIIQGLNSADTTAAQDYTGAKVYFDIDELEQDGMVVLNDYSNELTVPRLTTQQTAAISAGLQMLKQLSGFEHNDDIDGLLNALHSGSGGMSPDTIAIEPTKADSDLETLREAILDGVAITCDYINGKGERSTGRVIEPLRLESRDNFWYLKGFCHSHNEVRNFRLDAMDKVFVTAQTIPEDHKSLPLDGPIYQPGANAIDVIIDVEPEGYQVLSDYAASYSAKTTGTIRASIKVTSLLTIPPMVASYGGAVRVIEPAEARVLVRDYALKALGRGTETTDGVTE
jgi:proteasome accessory factor C